MNPYTNLLKPEAEARIRQEIGSISGLAIQRLTAVPPVNMNSMGLINVCIKLTGWSPSLNEILMHWRATAYMDDDASTQGERTLERLAGRLQNQRHRLAEGLALGAAAPFGICGEDGRRQDTEWGHILVDRGLATLLEAEEAGRFDREVCDAIYDLHQDDHGERDGLEGVLTGDATDDDCQPFGIRELIGRELRQDVRLAGGALYDGGALKVPGSIPETLLGAAVGRPLSALVAVPDAIAGHIITGATHEEGRVRIDVQPVLEAASTLLGEMRIFGFPCGNARNRIP